MEIYLEQLHVRVLIDELHSIIKPMLEKNNNKLEIKLDNDFVIKTDYVRIRQSLLNLLSNAAKFTKNGLILLTAKCLNKENKE